MATYSEPHQAPNGSAWFVTGHSEDYSVPIRIFDRDDTSFDEPTPYDSHCSLCWLGYAHSGKLHRQSLNRW